MVVQSTGCDKQNESICHKLMQLIPNREFCSNGRAEHGLRQAKRVNGEIYGTSETSEINFVINNTSSDRSHVASMKLMP